MWSSRKFRPAEILFDAAGHKRAAVQHIGELPQGYAAPAALEQQAHFSIRSSSSQQVVYPPGPPTPPKLSFTLDEELSAQLLSAARAGDQTPGELVSELLAHGLGRWIQRARLAAALETLTPRERQVVHMAGRGQTNRQIGQLLVISPETVKSHMRHALGKLGLRSKGDLRLLMLDLSIRRRQES